MTKIQDERFKSRFQIISDTGISGDYFNNILLVGPEVILNPNRYYERGEQELREILVDMLKELTTYSEYSRHVVARHNAPTRDFDGKLHQTRELVSLDDFIGAENIDRVKELDRTVTAMKSLGITTANIDLTVLIDSMYKASLLIARGGSSSHSTKQVVS